ncbi:MAG: phosphodiesterase [Ilumatobacter sp.]
MLIAQISDCHIVEPDRLFADQVDSAAGLRAAIGAIGALDRRPDLVLATGDLVNDGTSEQYDHLEEILGGLDIPVIPVAGNHDDRTELRRRFGGVVPSGEPGDPICFTIDDHQVRLVILDTTIPGRHDGAIDDDQLAWLEDQLRACPDRPTIVVQHHPPFITGLRWMDEHCGFATGEAEAAVLSGHDHVEAVVCGHLHRAIQRRLATTIAMVCPSTAAPLDLELGDGPFAYSTEPTGFLLHEWRPENGLTSHVVSIGEHRRWTPTWSE